MIIEHNSKTLESCYGNMGGVRYSDESESEEEAKDLPINRHQTEKELKEWEKEIKDAHKASKELEKRMANSPTNYNKDNDQTSV